jgi:putative hydrolase of the HAD superfamily
VAAAILVAERDLWQATGRSHRSATLAEVFERAGVTVTEEFLASYFETWEPHTFTDPEAAPLMRSLRERGIKVGVLSNTMWPRSAHERVFLRDQVLELIDGAVYSSEIAWAKPHPEAFRAAMAAVGMSDPAGCVFVGDRPYDDVHGAKGAGMRAVLIPQQRRARVRRRGPRRRHHPPVRADPPPRRLVAAGATGTAAASKTGPRWAGTATTAGAGTGTTAGGGDGNRGGPSAHVAGGRGPAGGQAPGWAMAATRAPAARTRPAGASSISSPRRPPLQKMVANPSAEESMTTGSGLRWPSGEMPPAT